MWPNPQETRKLHFCAVNVVLCLVEDLDLVEQAILSPYLIIHLLNIYIILFRSFKGAYRCLYRKLVIVNWFSTEKVWVMILHSWFSIKKLLKLYSRRVTKELTYERWTITFWLLLLYSGFRFWNNLN